MKILKHLSAFLLLLLAATGAEAQVSPPPTAQFSTAETFARQCMHNQSLAALRHGAGDQVKIMMDAISVCADPLMDQLHNAGMTDDRALPFVQGIAADELHRAILEEQRPAQ